ncbi:hypothetical protein [Halopseudomonas salegens]|uniref:Uncharacterized protein n=1 Tax=Halopseudomonas salegens TaxID=1434072 RepID=A0A1H2FHS7_9GAMM|nr:hypothetical protein [Halopseudomonas salegens]SDU06508.1 hypothetical protein SAMN05216210_1546 [Halopseudomonas salegens]
MSDCPESVIGLRLDQESTREVERIRRKYEASLWINALLSVAVINSIFTRSSPPVAGWNITQVDWQSYSKAMINVPMITRGAIERDMKLMVLHYEMPGNYDYKHSQFWRGLLNGCAMP